MTSRSAPCIAPSSSAARSSTRPGSTVRAEARNSSDRRFARTRTPASSSRRKSRRRTCGGRHAPTTRVHETYPPDHIREYTEKSLENLGVDVIDLQQFHVWNDAWADDDGWKRAIDDLRTAGLVRAVGISINRWEPANVIRALDTGLIDSVQVVYNIFDQAPEDELFPYCEAHGIAVIARVPFDEGSLTGALTAGSRWPDGDYRNLYFTPDNLRDTLQRVDRLRPLVPEGMELPEMALRFILEHPAVSTVIPGMRRLWHVEHNLAASDGQPLSPRLRDALRQHRWDRGMLISFSP